MRWIAVVVSAAMAAGPGPWASSALAQVAAEAAPAAAPIGAPVAGAGAPAGGASLGVGGVSPLSGLNLTLGFRGLSSQSPAPSRGVSVSGVPAAPAGASAPAPRGVSSAPALGVRASPEGGTRRASARASVVAGGAVVSLETGLSGLVRAPAVGVRGFRASPRAFLVPHEAVGQGAPVDRDGIGGPARSGIRAASLGEAIGGNPRTLARAGVVAGEEYDLSRGKIGPSGRAPNSDSIAAHPSGYEVALDSLFDHRQPRGGDVAAAWNARPVAELVATDAGPVSEPRLGENRLALRPALAPAAVQAPGERRLPGLAIATPPGDEPSASARPARPGRPWVRRVAFMGAAFLALDWGTKLLFAATGLPFVYHVLGPTRLLIMKVMVPVNVLVAAYYVGLAHSKEPPLLRLREFRRRHPLLGGALYGALAVLTFPVGLGEKRYAGDLAEKYPLLRRLVRGVEIAAAGMLAAGLGNGLEAIARGKVVDFIPFGHGRMNFSDSFIFLGMPFLWMALDFFKAAREADAAGAPVAFKNWRYWLGPLLGFVGFVYSTSWGYDRIPVAGWYVLLFSTLFSIGIFLGDLVLQRFVDAFNRARGPSAR